MKAIWKGTISFGLVSIPVDLYPAVESNDLKFNLIDNRDENKIKYQRINEATGEEVSWDNIARAYEFDDGNYVVMTDEDFVKADAAATKTLDIETFIKKEELSFLYLEKPYYIVPDKGGEKPYVLLREVMKKTGRIAVARAVIRTKGYLAAVYPLKDALVLNLIRFHDEIRSAEELDIPLSQKISAKEMVLAETLIHGMSEEWQPDKYKDEYRDAVMKRIEGKSRKTLVEADEKEVYEEAASGKIIDIMDLLKRSVEAKKQQADRKVVKGR
ncbi:MAG: non-homologous end joining protein Ku [Christensenellales bacterium]